MIFIAGFTIAAVTPAQLFQPLVFLLDEMDGNWSKNTHTPLGGLVYIPKKMLSHTTQFDSIQRGKWKGNAFPSGCCSAH